MELKEGKEEYSYELKIPKDRVGVLIGIKGKEKRDIESKTKTKLNINSKEGDVSVIGSDPIGIFTAKEIVKAIGRGFNPEIAMLLLNEDYMLEVVDIKQFTKNKSSFERLKGRVIGTNGKSRKTIEDLSQAHISVYGKTVAIIGEVDNADAARRAVESLLRGSEHGNVYKSLENRRRDMNKSLMAI